MLSRAQGLEQPPTACAHRRERVLRAGAGSAFAALPRRVDTSCSSSAALAAPARPRRVRPEGAGSCEGLGAAAARPRLLRTEAASAASPPASSSAARLLPRPRAALAGGASSAGAAAPRRPRPAGLAGSSLACSGAGSGSAAAAPRLLPRLAAGLQCGMSVGVARKSEDVKTHCYRWSHYARGVHHAAATAPHPLHATHLAALAAAAAAAASAAAASCLAVHSTQNQSPLGTRLSGGWQQDRWQALSHESHSSRMSPSSAGGWCWG